MKKAIAVIVLLSSAQSFARLDRQACQTNLMNKYFGTVYNIASQSEFVGTGYGFYLAYKNIDGYHINPICVYTDLDCHETGKAPVTVKGCW